MSSKETNMFDDLFRAMERGIKWPHYNVKETDQSVILEVALAGFEEDELEVSVRGRTLVIKGARKPDDSVYSYRGIAGRDFTLEFPVVNLEVADAKFRNGILSVILDRTTPNSKVIKLT